MTTYTAITNGEIDQDSPVTQPLLTALRDNPIAIAEGASGAPKVQGQALDNVFLGFFEASGSSGSFSSAIPFDTQAKSLFIHDLQAPATSPYNRTIQARFSTDGGSTWGSAQNISSSSQSAIALSGEIDLEDGTTSGRVITGTLTVPSGANAISIGFTISSGTTSFSFFAFLFGGKA